MSNLTLSRNFFNGYAGAVLPVKTKHVTFSFFSGKADIPISDLISYQAAIEDVKIPEGSAVEVADGLVEGLGEEFAKVLSKSLTRRFTDDRRNWENGAHQRPRSLGSAMRQAAERVIEGGNLDEQTAFLTSLGIMEMTETKEYAALNLIVNPPGEQVEGDEEVQEQVEGEEVQEQVEGEEVQEQVEGEEVQETEEEGS